jgi:outer membrane murein-binding lipoprotein Lpp
MKFAVAAVALAGCAHGSGVNEEVSAAANPIRKVVTLLQRMEKKVQAEAKAGEDLFNKYMCYCKTGGSDLTASIGAANTKIPEVASAIKEAEAQKTQLEADLVSHRSDREAANTAMAKATSIRQKEAKAFATFKSDSDTNIAAINKAVHALESGMAGGSFLQTGAAQLIRKLFQTQMDVSDIDRQDVLAFLSGGASQGYSPQSGQITGILKQSGDDMSKALAEATADENASIKNFDELMAAKTKEVNTLTAAIEEKTVRSGEVAVNIVMMKEDLSDTEAALLDDQKFLEDLEKNCAHKEAEWAEISKTRSEELVALADTIKLLNDDDALELFKKTLPSASSSLLQVQTGAAELRERASQVIRQARGNKVDRHQLDFILLALRGKGAGFANVIKMIDEMVARLKSEQTDDDNKKEYCSIQLDATEDKKKALDQSIADAEKSAADAEDLIATLTSEIKALNEGIKALDKSVTEATLQRKDEHAEYSELMSSNTAAVDLLGIAKNRLNKFYNPALYVAPPKRELSEEDRIAVNMGGTAPPTPAPGGIAGTGITAFVDISEHAKPAPPPEAPKYAKKTEESTGVIGMMDMLIADLDKEMQEAETEEKDAQAEYEQMAKDSAAKRIADSNSVAEKEAAKANAEATLQHQTEAKSLATKELFATVEFISSLHAECDWLMQNFDMRKEARANEVESLKKAKAVLSGADFSLLQQPRNLRGRA